MALETDFGLSFSNEGISKTVQRVFVSAVIEGKGIALSSVEEAVDELSSLSVL